MRHLTLAAATLALLLSACATKLVEENYAGPTAVVRDTYTNFVATTLFKAGHADFFVMSRADGKYIENALQKTASANQGRGFTLAPYDHQRRVPVRPIKAELRAQTFYSAPISGLLHDTHEVSGTVNFDPVAGETYIVTGELRDGYSAVWIATADGRQVTEKVVRRK
jgi:hypothetical protein